MKYSLDKRPIKSTPQAYEKFLKGLEKELRERFRVVVAEPSDEQDKLDRLWTLLEEVLGVSEGEEKEAKNE